jgi:transcriptional regulator with XRE-family HTH domain
MEVVMTGADLLDEVIGRRIRILRLERGLSQPELGALIGASALEIDLFEKGAKRVGAARLMRIAKVFDINVSVFFGGEAGPDETAQLEDTLHQLADQIRQGSSRSVH